MRRDAGRAAFATQPTYIRDAKPVPRLVPGSAAASPRQLGPRLQLVSPAEAKASHRHKLWSTLHAREHSAHTEKVRRMDDAALIAPLAGSRRTVAKVSSKLHRDVRKSTVVSERVYMALQRHGVRSKLEVEDLLNFVTQIHPLKLMTLYVRRSLCEQASLVTFAQGERICKQGDVADSFYVILTGAVQVYKEDPNAKEDPFASPRDSPHAKRRSKPQSASRAPEATSEPASLDALLGGDDDDEEDEEQEPAVAGGLSIPRAVRSGPRVSCEAEESDDSPDSSPRLRKRANSSIERDVAESLRQSIPAERQITVLVEGDGFGQAALTDDVCSRLRGASCVAIHPTSCLFISHDMFNRAQEEEASRRDDEKGPGQVDDSDAKPARRNTPALHRKQSVAPNGANIAASMMKKNNQDDIFRALPSYIPWPRGPFWQRML